MPAPGSDPAALAAARVLVVDDVADNRDLLVRRLRRLGIGRCTEAADGQAALDLLARERFDLMLLDIMMPGINGYGVLEALRGDARSGDMPVIVISALNEIDAVVRCIELGAEDFLLKPFNPTLLRARVSASLEKKLMRDRQLHLLVRQKTELAEARTLQLALIPADIVEAGLELRAMLEPAREVGGDLVDHFGVGPQEAQPGDQQTGNRQMGGGLHVLLLGDVSDKGAGAALTMARTHALFRGLAGRPDAELLFRNPARAMAAVNAELCPGNVQCMFVTMLVAVLDTATLRLDYVRAGHVPPYLRRMDGTLARLNSPAGLPLGLRVDAAYAARTVSLQPGDTVVIVSDGVTEGLAPDRRAFGDAGMEAWLASSATPSLPGLLARLREHEAGQPPSDDVALLLLRLDADAAAGFSATLTPGPEEIGGVLDAADSFLRGGGVDDRTRHHVALGLDELLANLASHGGAPDRPATLRLRIGPDQVDAELEDSGLPYDPREASMPDVTAGLDEREAGGLGLFLLDTLAESIDYVRRDGRNVTSFRMRRPAAPDGT